MWNILFMTAILLYDKPAGGCMFLCIDHTFFFTVFLLCGFMTFLPVSHLTRVI